VKSQALVEALDRQLDLRAMFGRDGIDWISRFNTDDPIEDLVNIGNGTSRRRSKRRPGS
jgi:capsular polysaccharide transport system permease protein